MVGSCRLGGEFLEPLPKLIPSPVLAVCLWAGYKTSLCIHFLSTYFIGVLRNTAEIMYIKSLVYQKGVVPNLKVFIISWAQDSHRDKSLL